jgi:hypothetical protein
VSGTLLRAKLLGVRALSTVALALALASPAEGQIFGAPGRYSGASWWLGADVGHTGAVNMSDRASSANWGLEKAMPIRLSVDYGRRERTVGFAASQADVPLLFTGASCDRCRGQVTVQQALAHYRVTSPFFIRGLYSVTELSLGITRWNALQGRDGDDVGTVAPNNDFTYGISLGAALPLGDHLELTMAYDLSQLKHETQRSTATSALSNASVKLTTLRFGARVRLGK